MRTNRPHEVSGQCLGAQQQPSLPTLLLNSLRFTSSFRPRGESGNCLYPHFTVTSEHKARFTTCISIIRLWPPSILQLWLSLFPASHVTRHFHRFFRLARRSVFSWLIHLFIIVQCLIPSTSIYVRLVGSKLLQLTITHSLAMRMMIFSLDYNYGGFSMMRT